MRRFITVTGSRVDWAPSLALVDTNSLVAPVILGTLKSGTDISTNHTRRKSMFDHWSHKTAREKQYCHATANRLSAADDPTIAAAPTTKGSASMQGAGIITPCSQKSGSQPTHVYNARDSQGVVCVTDARGAEHGAHKNGPGAATGPFQVRLTPFCKSRPTALKKICKPTSTVLRRDRGTQKGSRCKSIRYFRGLAKIKASYRGSENNGGWGHVVLSQLKTK
jgi:hypothetical protein